MPNFIEYIKLLKFVKPDFMFKFVIVKNKGDIYQLPVGSSAFNVQSFHSHYDGSNPLYPGIKIQDIRDMDFKMNGRLGVDLRDERSFVTVGSGSSRKMNLVIGERGCTIVEWLYGQTDPSKATLTNVKWYFIFSLG